MRLQAVPKPPALPVLPKTGSGSLVLPLVAVARLCTGLPCADKQCPTWNETPSCAFSRPLPPHWREDLSECRCSEKIPSQLPRRLLSPPNEVLLYRPCVRSG